MLKARNILIIFILNYTIMFLVCSFIELWEIEKTVSEVISTIDMASDLAFRQVQSVEEVLGGKENNLTIKVVSDKGRVVEKPLFHLIDSYDLYNTKSLEKDISLKDDVNKDLFDKSSGSMDTINTKGLEKDELDVEKDEHVLRSNIFRKLFVENKNFKESVSYLNKSYRPVRYYDSSGVNFTWYYIPNISLMGYSLFNLKDLAVYDMNGNKVNQSFAKKILDYYGLSNYEKQRGDGNTLYLTPLNMGITYINKDLLNVLFTNNLQLLMTSKYGGNYKKAEGVYKGSYYSDMLKDKNISLYNPINNGSFTILLGEEQRIDGVKIYKGVSPEIEYKVIDMYDPSNDKILKYLFGANKGSYSTKAEYLKSLDMDILNPVTNTPYDKKFITVAKVKFYVHVLIPYKSLLVRDYMRFKENVNYFSVSDNVMTFEVTKLFAVTP